MRNRLVWMDFLKMTLSILVVYHHCYGIFSVPPPLDYFDLFYLWFTVPCFYALSGFMAYTPLIARPGGAATLPQSVWSKFRALVVPAMIFFLLAAPGSEAVSSLKYGMAGGNYFLIALFDIFVLNYILTALSAAASETVRLAIVSAAAAVTTILVAIFHDTPLLPYLAWKDFLYGNLFFVLGLYIGRFRQTLFNTMTSTAFPLSAALLYAIQYMIALHIDRSTPSGDLTFRLLTKITLSATGIIMLISCSYRLFINSSPKTRLSRLITYFGSRSLAAYVISWIYVILFARMLRPFELTYTLAAHISFVAAVYLLSVDTYDLLCAIPYVRQTVFGKTR